MHDVEGERKAAAWRGILGWRGNVSRHRLSLRSCDKVNFLDNVQVLELFRTHTVAGQCFMVLHMLTDY